MTSDFDELLIKQLFQAGIFFCDTKLGLKNLLKREGYPLFAPEDVTMLIEHCVDMGDKILGSHLPPVHNEEIKRRNEQQENRQRCPKRKAQDLQSRHQLQRRRRARKGPQLMKRRQLERRSSLALNHLRRGYARIERYHIKQKV